ncbi:MAG: hypothetical protein ACRBEE_02555 [Arenicella sp.]
MSGKNLQLLDFLVGDWESTAVTEGVTIQRSIRYQWVYKDNFLEATSERKVGNDVIEMTIIYLWDALASEIRSWVRASDGEWSQATVTVVGDGIIQLHSEGANAKGERTSLISTLDQVDSDTRTETWTDIIINDVSMPSPESIVWNRSECPVGV